MRIGILGGTFDPIHKTHIRIAKGALDNDLVDKILIMPSPCPPHKKSSNVTDSWHRINMIKLAIEDYKDMELSTFELDNNFTYTADTLTQLNNHQDDFYFIVGGDSIASFSSWYHPEIILNNCELIAVKRADSSAEDFIKNINKIESEFTTKVHILNIDSDNISSSSIKKIGINHAKAYLDEKVYQYIVDNNLYKDTIISPMNLTEIKADIQKNLTPSRYIHTLGVAETAKNMAQVYNYNPNTAYLAAILHDVAKNYSDEELLKMAKANNIEISDSELNAPYLLHAKLGAFIAENKYHITDSEVLSAIRWHTTGKADMTTLDKIIFCADYIEPGRTKQERLDYLRELSLLDLDLLTFEILKQTVDYLKKTKGDNIDPNTINAYEYYRKVIDNRNDK